MSDQNGGLQPEVPRVDAPQPGIGAAPAPKKHGWIIALIVGVALLCAMSNCAAAVIGFSLLPSAEEKAISKAESHYSTAVTYVRYANSALLELAGETDASTIESVSIDAGATIRFAQDELTLARSAIEELDDSRGREDYIASIDEAFKAIDALNRSLEYEASIRDMVATLKAATDHADQATDDLNSAINEGNSGNYKKMKAKAKAASAGWVKAQDVLYEAEAIDPGAGLDKAVKYAGKRKAQADMLVKMAGYGQARRITAYNKAATAMNKLGHQATQIGEPEILRNPLWMSDRLRKIQREAVVAADASERLRVKALMELDYTP